MSPFYHVLLVVTNLKIALLTGVKVRAMLIDFHKLNQ